MPRKLDLSDRYARGGQRRSRRRTLAPSAVERVDEITADRALTPGSPAPIVTAPLRGTVTPRANSAASTNYHYVRTDLTRIAVVVGILVLLMAVLYVVLR